MRIIVGLQPVREAIAAHGKRLEKVLVEDKRGAPRLDALARFAADRGVRVERTPRRDLDKLAHGVGHQGAAAVAPPLELVELERLAETEGPLIALDEIEDPQNFGAIIRSAVALGARGVLFPEHRAAPLSLATFRASAGAIEHATLCRVASLTSALQSLAERGMQIVGLDMQGKDIDRAPFEPPIVLVVGAEGKGLRKSVRAVCSLVVRVPMRGPVASLNASVAAAIALYATLRTINPGA
jgi:23S rRNA (guanosine2251-2'-O)-methyltransferase